MSITGHDPPQPRRYRALPGPGSAPRGRLEGLSEESILDELLHLIRRVLEDEGVAARISRKGWHEGHLSWKVVDGEVRNVTAGSQTSYQRPPPGGG